MPNRIIKESVCSSENIDNLTPQEEVLFYRIMVNCDDYGLMDARIAILKARCFPLRPNLKAEILEKWLSALVENELLFLYFVDGRRYLKMTAWEKHQQIRAKKSKYPKPDINGNHIISDDINGNQIPAHVTVIQSNPIQSESNTVGQENIYRNIIDRLNSKAETSFKYTSQKTKDLIKARLNDNFKESDFYTVIDKKCIEWLNTDMAKYLRPETLFSNKFEGYLNQKDIIPKKGKEKQFEEREYKEGDIEDLYWKPKEKAT